MAWMAARLVSSKRDTRYASAASWRAAIAEDWNRKSAWHRFESVSVSKL